MTEHDQTEKTMDDTEIVIQRCSPSDVMLIGRMVGVKNVLEWLRWTKYQIDVSTGALTRSDVDAIVEPIEKMLQGATRQMADVATKYQRTQRVSLIPLDSVLHDCDIGPLSTADAITIGSGVVVAQFAGVWCLTQCDNDAMDQVHHAIGLMEAHKKEVYVDVYARARKVLAHLRPAVAQNHAWSAVFIPKQGRYRETQAEYFWQFKVRADERLDR